MTREECVQILINLLYIFGSLCFLTAGLMSLFQRLKG